MNGRMLVRTVLLGVVVCLSAGHSVHGEDTDDAAALAQLIDRHIEARLEAEGVVRVPQAEDAEFLRRAMLDLHGVVPSAAQAREFLDRREPNKRLQLIDDLLASSRYGEHFADLWRKRLLPPSVNDQRAQADRYTAWLAQRLNQNDGWNKIALELLTASGKIEDNPAVLYLIEGRYPLPVTDLTDLTSRYFLGVRLNCAQCHDHPFVDWKQREYWGMAAFFAQIQTPGRSKKVYQAGIVDDPKITLALLPDLDSVDGFRATPPTFLGGEDSQYEGDKPLRVAFAKWATAPENPYFARAAVNRLWWHFFGRGIVNPVDDMHTGNAPSHPELLELLRERFVRSGFDLKFLARAIMSSRTYQQTSRPGSHADREAELFARMSVKVLSAEQLYDSLVAVLGPPAKSRGIDTRFGLRHEFTQFFAGSGDLDPTSYDRGIPHALRMMNSPQFAGQNVEQLVSRTATAGRPAEEVIEELFLTILSRRPTSDEVKLVNVEEPGQNVYEELAWALLMSSEFTLNH